MRFQFTLAGLAAAAVLTGCGTIGAPGAPQAGAARAPDITQADVLNAQRGWCDALVRISSEYKARGKDSAIALSRQIIDQAYGYKQGVVLFKPTLTSAPQTFRNDGDGALSYFASGNPKYKDSGFALKGWTKCEVVNSGIHYERNMALTMGNVIFTNDKGEVTTVDKTWAFKKFPDGSVRIVLHHSSLPFTSDKPH